MTKYWYDFLTCFIFGLAWRIAFPSDDKAFIFMCFLTGVVMGVYRGVTNVR